MFNYHSIINNLVNDSIVRVFDVSGRLLVIRDENNYILEISLPIKGVYSIQVQNNLENWTQKIVNW